MPLFYFDTKCRGGTVFDRDGEVFSDFEKAVAHGLEAAAQYCADGLARGRIPEDNVMVIRSEDGCMTTQFSFGEALIATVRGARAPHIQS